MRPQSILNCKRIGQLSERVIRADIGWQSNYRWLIGLLFDREILEHVGEWHCRGVPRARLWRTTVSIGKVSCTVRPKTGSYYAYRLLRHMRRTIEFVRIKVLSSYRASIFLISISEAHNDAANAYTYSLNPSIFYRSQIAEIYRKPAKTSRIVE